MLLLWSIKRMADSFAININIPAYCIISVCVYKTNRNEMGIHGYLSSCLAFVYIQKDKRKSRSNPVFINWGSYDRGLCGWVDNEVKTMYQCTTLKPPQYNNHNKQRVCMYYKYHIARGGK